MWGMEFGYPELGIPVDEAPIVIVQDQDLAYPLANLLDVEEVIIDEENAHLSSVYFVRDNQLFHVHLHLIDLPEEYMHFSMLVEESMKSTTNQFLAGNNQAPLPHNLYFDPNSRNTFAIITTKQDIPVFAAETLEKEVTQVISPFGYIIDHGLVCKTNSSSFVTKKEAALLEAIANDPELQALGVSAPKIYGHRENRLGEQHLPYDTVEDIIQNHPKRKNLIERIVKATEIIERKTPDYFPELHNHNIPPAQSVAALGNAHETAVQYLQKAGHFNTWLSDSRLANWLYDSETDTLFKIDENALLKGSQWSFIARVADFNHLLTEQERDALYEPSEDAHLSLYVTNMEGAAQLKQAGKQELYQKRLISAGQYLNKLSDRWQPLKAEFALYQNANARAA